MDSLALTQEATLGDIIEKICITKDSAVIESLYYDGQRWNGSFASLKQFVGETLDIILGTGGAANKFSAKSESGEELFFTWYAKKQHTIVLSGRLGLKLQEKLLLSISELQQYRDDIVSTHAH
jgi:hypothetical protein